MKVDLILKGNNIFTKRGFFSGAIAVENSKIIKIKKDINIQADEIIEAENNLVLPGIIDVHVHFRDMGEAQKEAGGREVKQQFVAV